MDNIAVLVLVAGGSFVFFLAMIAMLLWYDYRTKRHQHEERMFALQRGLLPPEWVNDPARGRRRAWLGLCLGLPIFIACALAWGTFQLVQGSINSGRDFTPLLITIWSAGGAVAIAAVIMGGLGLLADQRIAHRQAPRADVPRMQEPAGPFPQERKASSEQIWKPE